MYIDIALYIKMLNIKEIHNQKNIMNIYYVMYTFTKDHLNFHFHISN